MAIEASLPTLCNNHPQDWMDGGLFINGSSNQPFQPQQQMKTMMPTFPPPIPTVTFADAKQSFRPVSMNSSQSLAALMEKQKQEMDLYVRLHSTRLRAALQQQWRNHVACLLRNVEWKAAMLLRVRDEELAKAKQRATELEECLKRAEQERDGWQRISKEKEAVALYLRHTLEQVRVPCCSSTGEEVEDVASSSAVAKDDDDEEKATGGRLCLPCRSCGSRESCVLLLPCRHLCTCQTCEALLVSCPVCGSVKRGSSMVFLA